MRSSIRRPHQPAEQRLKLRLTIDQWQTSDIATVEMQ
jgi:hypothetical protein